MYDVVLTANHSPWSRYHGGIQKSVDQLGLAMHGLGAKVGVVFSRTPWETIALEPRPYDLHWVSFMGLKPGASSPGRFLNAVFFTRLLRKIAGPQTILQGNGDEAWLFPRAFPGRLLYSHRQPIFPEYLQGDWEKWQHRTKVFLKERKEWAYARGVLLSDIVTCTSQFSANQLQQVFQLPAPPRVVHNGIDPVFVSQPIPNQEARIIYFGRLARGKGVLELFDAWKAMPDELRHRFPLHLIGGGELEGYFKDQQRFLDAQSHLVMRGALRGASLATEVGRAALVVLPSSSESFGNTMLESIAMGQRIISVRAGSIPEVVGPHADLLEKVDPRILRDLMISRLHDWNYTEPIEQRAERRQWVDAHFGWKKAAQEFLTLHELLRRKLPR